jgi:hypothetical protein
MPASTQRNVLGCTTGGCLFAGVLVVLIVAIRGDWGLVALALGIVLASLTAGVFLEAWDRRPKR